MVSRPLPDCGESWDGLWCSSLTETSATGYNIHIIHVRPNGGVKRQHDYATGD